MFPDQKVQEIYQRYQVEKCYVYQNLTDTDSTSMFFVFICKNCMSNLIVEMKNWKKGLGFLKLKVLMSQM